MFANRIVVIAAVAAIFFATASPAIAGPKEVERPFRGSWTGQAVDTTGVECPPGTFPGRTVASGQATHWGRFELVAEGCSQILDAAGGIATGTASYTVANGDEVHISFVGAFTFNDDGSVTGVYPATGAWGTGRFQNVVLSGTDTVTGFVDGSSTGVLEGTIIFDASDRSSD